MCKQILVIDDDPEILEVVSLVLTDKRYQLETATDGKYLQSLASHPADLILLDDWLPDRPGREWCRDIKRNPGTAQIPVILFSAAPRLEEVANACGADAYYGCPPPPAAP